MRTPPTASSRPSAPPAQRLNDAFRQELPHETGAPRAQRRPDRDLTLTGCGPRQQQVGNVRATDEEDERYRAEEHEEKGTHGPPHLLGHRDEGDAKVLAIVGVLGAKPIQIRRHSRLRLSDRHARTQTRNRFEAMGATIPLVRWPELERHV